MKFETPGQDQTAVDHEEHREGKQDAESLEGSGEKLRSSLKKQTALAGLIGLAYLTSVGCTDETLNKQHGADQKENKPVAAQAAHVEKSQQKQETKEKKEVDPSLLEARMSLRKMLTAEAATTNEYRQFIKPVENFYAVAATSDPRTLDKESLSQNVHDFNELLDVFTRSINADVDVQLKGIKENQEWLKQESEKRGQDEIFYEIRRDTFSHNMSIDEYWIKTANDLEKNLNRLAEGAN